MSDLLEKRRWLEKNGYLSIYFHEPNGEENSHPKDYMEYDGPCSGNWQPNFNQMIYDADGEDIEEVVSDLYAEIKFILADKCCD